MPKSVGRIYITEPEAARIALRRAQLALLEAGLSLSAAQIAAGIITRTPIDVILEELGASHHRTIKEPIAP